MSLLAQAIIAALIFVAGGMAAHRWDVGQQAIKDNARIETQLQREKAARLVANTAATGHEADKVKIQTKFQTITERVDHEIEVEKVVYRNVCISPGGLQQLADAAAETGYTREPANPMPAASAAK